MDGVVGDKGDHNFPRFFVGNLRFKLTSKLVLVCWGSDGADEDLIHIYNSSLVGEETGFCSSRHYINCLKRPRQSL